VPATSAEATSTGGVRRRASTKAAGSAIKSLPQASQLCTAPIWLFV
jgi:hypothetical protein